MKKLILILILVSIVLVSGCNIKKDSSKNVVENERVKDLFNKNGLSLENLKLDSIVEEKDFGVNHLNLTNIRFNQEYKGLPIYSSQIIYIFNEDILTSVMGYKVDNLDLSIEPKITKNVATSIIKSRANSLRPDIKLEDEDITLGIYNKELVYGVNKHVVIVISAIDKRVLYEFNGLMY